MGISLYMYIKGVRHKGKGVSKKTKTKTNMKKINLHFWAFQPVFSLLSPPEEVGTGLKKKEARPDESVRTGEYCWRERIPKIP